MSYKESQGDTQPVSQDNGLIREHKESLGVFHDPFIELGITLFSPSVEDG